MRRILTENEEECPEIKSQWANERLADETGQKTVQYRLLRFPKYVV